MKSHVLGYLHGEAQIEERSCFSESYEATSADPYHMAFKNAVQLAISGSSILVIENLR